MKRIGTIAVMLLCLVSLGALAQTNTAGCGGTTCVQPRIGTEPLQSDSATEEALLFVSQNGAKLIYGSRSEDVTLATGATTTDTTKNLLPANSFILSVTGVVSTTITAACTGWQLGDPTTAGRFTANNTTLTAGTSDVGKVHATTGVASATTGIWQAAAAKVRITCAGGNPGAGKVRVTSTYFTFVPPMP